MLKKIVITTLLLLDVCGASTAQDLTGAGATFPAPLYAQMFTVYQQTTQVSVSYQAIGSSGGGDALLERAVDFAGSDAFLTDEVLSKAPGQILHIPMAVGAVVLGYNFEPLARSPDKPLVLSGEVAADLFLGVIKNWNDPRLTALNPGVVLPNLPVTVVHRSDGSGTTSIFVDYLAKVSPTWAAKVSSGPQTQIVWPTGLAGDGNPGVASLIAETPGAIGYLGLEYAAANGVAYADMVNAAGVKVKPELIAVAAAAAVLLPDDLRTTFSNSTDPQAWPVAGFTWLLIYREQAYDGRSLEQAQRTVALLRWMLSTGQNYNNDLNYGQITGPALTRALELLDTVTYDGQRLSN